MKHSFSLSEAAEELGVSAATVRNWLKSDEAGEGTIEELRRLAEKRLTHRANKRNLRGNRASGKKFLEPFWSMGGRRFLEFYWEKKETFPESDLLRGIFLFCLGHHLCVLRKRTDPRILQEMDAWKAALTKEAESGGVHSWKSLAEETSEWLRANWKYAGEADVLGGLSLEMSRRGTLAEQGAFYTPEPAAREAVERLADAGNWEGTPTFLDPACGSGVFLREIRRRFQLPLSAVFGMDLDPTAVRIARLNLLFDVPNSPESPCIVCWDGLLPDLPEGMPTSFTAIAANPPWGAKKAKKPKKQNAQERSEFCGNAEVLSECGVLGVRGVQGEREMFTRFLRRSWELLQPGGTAVFLLPEAFLNIRTHASIRRFLLENAQIEEAVSIGRAFEGVFTPAVRFVFRKPVFSHSSAKVSQSAARRFPQERFLQIPDYIISPNASAETFRIVEKMYAVPHETLAGHASWGLGIVTGNNARWLSEEPKSEDWEPILCGPDVEPFRIREPKKWIHFRPECFQQTIPEERFRVPEKIVYRFITSRPAFALDTQQRLTLNSANFLVPSIPGLSIWAVLAFLNSEAFRFLFVQQFFTRKVLRGDLERLPFPKISKKFAQNLEILAGDVFSGKEVCAKMEEQIFSTFNLTRTEIQFIRRSLKK